VIGIELKFEPYTIKPIQTLFWRYKTLNLNFVFSFDRNRLQDADHWCRWRDGEGTDMVGTKWNVVKIICAP